MIKLKYNPIQLTAIFLAIYSLCAIFTSTFQVMALVHFGIIAGSVAIFTLIFRNISKNKKILDNTIISALILFLVWHPFNSILTVFAVALIMVSKYFLEYKNTSVVNPVAGSLLIVSLLNQFTNISPNNFVSWWGTSFIEPLSLILMAIWLLTTFRKWNRYWVTLTFLAIHLIITIIKGQILQFPGLTFGVFSQATIYFMAAIMLIDPKSSPALKKTQIIYGIIAAITYNILLFTQIADAELWAIIIANLYNFSLKFAGVKSTVIKT